MQCPVQKMPWSKNIWSMTPWEQIKCDRWLKFRNLCLLTTFCPYGAVYPILRWGALLSWLLWFLRGEYISIVVTGTHSYVVNYRGWIWVGEFENWGVHAIFTSLSCVVWFIVEKWEYCTNYPKSIHKKHNIVFMRNRRKISIFATHHVMRIWFCICEKGTTNLPGNSGGGIGGIIITARLMSSYHTENYTFLERWGFPLPRNIVFNAYHKGIPHAVIMISPIIPKFPCLLVPIMRIWNHFFHAMTHPLFQYHVA